ncbi:putative membrane protein [Clostridium botulinum 202F]|nr:putative membrane protein [Clostridium botulinum 202F]
MFEKVFKIGFILIMLGYLTIMGLLITVGIEFLF